MARIPPDGAYFARRARQSHRAADVAQDVGPAGIHATMALAYDRLAQGADRALIARQAPEAADDASAGWENEGGSAGETTL